MPKKRIHINLTPPFGVKDLGMVAFIIETLANDLENNKSRTRAGYVGESFINKRGVTVQRVLRAIATVLYKMAGANKKR